MIIFPAIDLRNGKVVRLTQGDYNRMTVYEASPLETVKSFINAGATHLHTVDLEGAKKGSPVNQSVIKELCSQGLFVQMGGGMRSQADVENALNLGVSRVIIGTMALENFEELTRISKLYPNKIAVGVDTKNEYIATNGWLETSKTKGIDFCKGLLDIGINTVIYTDIAKDGQLQGTNLEIYEKLAQIKGLQIIASGGVCFEYEIKQLAEMGIYGAIVGKALYENKLDLATCIQLASGGKICC